MSNEQQNSGNPNWSSILDKIPEEFHHLVKPELLKWDQGVQQRFQEIHKEYEPYKPYKNLVDNGVDVNYVEQAVMLADAMQREPQKVTQQLIDAYKLDYVSKASVQQEVGNSASGQDDDDDDLFGDTDIMKHPKVKEMYNTLNQMQSEFTKSKQQEEEERELAEFEDYLDGLEQKYTGDNLPFNRMFVTALISQGADGEAAVAQYHQLLAGNAVVKPPEETTTDAPPVMGGDGSFGAGVADGSIDFGSLSKENLNATIEQMLTQQGQSGQG